MGEPLGAILLGVGSCMDWVVLFSVRGGGGSWPFYHVLPRLCSLFLLDRRLGQRVIQMRQFLVEYVSVGSMSGDLGARGDRWSVEWGSVDMMLTACYIDVLARRLGASGKGGLEFSCLVVRSTYG